MPLYGSAARSQHRIAFTFCYTELTLIIAEEGTRLYAVCLRGKLGSESSRTCLSTSCASVAFFASYGSSKLFQVLASSPCLIVVIEFCRRRDSSLRKSPSWRFKLHDVSNLPQHFVCFGRVFRSLRKLKTLSSSRFESLFDRCN